VLNLLQIIAQDTIENIRSNNKTPLAIGLDCITNSTKLNGLSDITFCTQNLFVDKVRPKGRTPKGISLFSSN
jgi:hypothetical protein